MTPYLLLLSSYTTGGCSFEEGAIDCCPPYSGYQLEKQLVPPCVLYVRVCGRVRACVVILIMLGFVSCIDQLFDEELLIGTGWTTRETVR